MGKSNIEWTDETWNPLRGCQRISPGCKNCYAERQAIRQSRNYGPYSELVKSTPDGPRWTGVVNVVEETLLKPLGWRARRTVFVDSMSDLFYEGFNAVEIARVYAVMAVAREHTFQVLTKRAARAEQLLNDAGFQAEVWAWAKTGGKYRSAGPGSSELRWPLRNVWHGVSAEDQLWLEQRARHLVRTPAVIRFLSLEPLLAPITLFDTSEGVLRGPAVIQSGGVTPSTPDQAPEGFDDSYSGVDWVIIGGESGPGARPCNTSWIRALVAQCRVAGVAPFVKQLGRGASMHTELGRGFHVRDGESTLLLKDSKGGDPAEWPEDLRIREFPEVADAA